MSNVERQFQDNLRDGLTTCAAITPAFFDSFEYTATGQNFCHSRVLGLMVRAAWSVRGVAAVDVDVRLNLGDGVKFQPDLIARDCDDRPLLIADFESPNSSDARIPEKDVKPYLKWSKQAGQSPPYFIVTALPRRPRSWELRWTAASQWNNAHRKNRVEIVGKPFDYWYAWYRREVRATLAGATAPIRFLNIDAGQLEAVDVA